MSYHITLVLPKSGIPPFGSRSTSPAGVRVCVDQSATPSGGHMIPKLMIQALHSTYYNDSIILRVIDQNEIDTTIAQRIIPITLINEKMNIIDNSDQTMGMRSFFNENSDENIDLLNMKATFTRMFHEIDVDKNGEYFLHFMIQTDLKRSKKQYFLMHLKEELKLEKTLVSHKDIS